MKETATKKSEKNVAVNRKARHDYFLEEYLECGISLTGTEIKSIRDGRVQFNDAYISIYKGEAWIKGMHISPYKYGNIFNVDPDRDRKLLLHKYEISKLFDKVRLKGYTLIPTRMYLKDGKAKIEIALAKGKDLYDKRQTEKLRDASREMQKALKFRS
ncbi:MAG: SsrA-binding protein SmpB [Solobacterium sp.]|jgi:SsrA-binding protein|nr:SsrA-binding protein SmpB [Solobacterium sp.]MCH4222448.1 SsrA-binding protein SmpB [Solobacterium sp.]MCH4265850.1 SsrA-binding protein SmpB [Solobacterium sp.]